MLRLTNRKLNKHRYFAIFLIGTDAEGFEETLILQMKTYGGVYFNMNQVNELVFTNNSLTDVIISNVIEFKNKHDFDVFFVDCERMPNCSS